MVKQNDGILFVRQSPGHDLAGQWTIPWGKVEPGELPSVAAIRESWEEGGVNASIVGLLGVQELPPPLEKSFALVYLCEHIGGEPAPQDRETDAARYLTVADLETFTEPFEPWSLWLVKRFLNSECQVITTDATNPLKVAGSFL